MARRTRPAGRADLARLAFAQSDLRSADRKAQALGEPGGPGNAKVTSLDAWLDVTADHPEEQFAGYDGNERTVQAVGANVKKELGFTPKVAYRHN